MVWCVRYQYNYGPCLHRIARYIDWTITTPLLLLQLLLGTGLPLSEIVAVIFFDLVMVGTGLFAALVPSGYKWGFFVFSCMSFFYIWGILIGTGRQSAYFISVEAGRAYTRSALFLIFVWMLYPVAWGLCDGGNVLHVSGEMIFYGSENLPSSTRRVTHLTRIHPVLDILAKPVFCTFHLYSLCDVPYEAFELKSGKVSTVASFTHVAPAMNERDKPYMTRDSADSETGNSTLNGASPAIGSGSRRVTPPVYELDVL